MKHILISCSLILSVGGCANIASRIGLGPKPEPVVVTPVAEPVAVEQPTLAPETAAPPPPATATTAAALDTTTPEQRAAAAAPSEAPSKALGKTTVTLGSPTEAGLWLKTPLVASEQQGRVTNPANGKSSLVTLIPIEGPNTAGSRMSLAAMRLIDLPLTDLTEVEVSLEG